MMKRCPACSRVYDDVSFRFCLDDGTELTNKLPDGGPPETAVMNPPQPNVVPTIEAISPPPCDPRIRDLPPTVAAVKRKRRAWPWIAGAALLVAVPAIVWALWWPKENFGWHLTIEVEPPANADAGAVVNQTIAVIRNRLNAAGVSRFALSPQGNRILVDLPVVEEPERIKSLISTGGKLQLFHVISELSPTPVQTYDTQEAAVSSLGSAGTIPSNRRILSYLDPDLNDAKKWVVVAAPPIVDGSNLRDAYAAQSPSPPKYDVMFSLDKAGAQKFGAWTAANINHYIAVSLNDEIKSIAYIMSQITDQGQISGNFTKREAEDLALVLKSGALPALVRFVEERVDK